MVLSIISIGLLVPMLCQAIQGPWRPVIHKDDELDRVYAPPPSSILQTNSYFGRSLPSPAQHPIEEQCALDKVGFTQDLYFQYIQYKTHMPDLKQFTLCFWSKFSNHSNDHPIFSYAVDGQPRAILSWVANSERSSYLSLSVEGHTLYRLNYPLRLNRWYHTCQSWNGKTGEWQIWVNAERVGRGFHNRLVDHVVPGGGLAISGQEQRQEGGGFQEGSKGGMLGEITMLQLYSVALTAGKAHRDHKHHHAHQFDKNGNQITTTRPTPAPQPTPPAHPLITGNQLNPMLRLNVVPAPSAATSVVPGQQFQTQLINGQFVNSLVSRQLSGSPSTQPARLLPAFSQALGRGVNSGRGSLLVNSGLVHPDLVNPANVQFIDERPQATTNSGGYQYQQLFKRSTLSRPKRQYLIGGGHIFDESAIAGPSTALASLDGLAGIGNNQPILLEQKTKDDREPAEAEVKAVQRICTGCDEEPFEKALVFGWRSVSKKLYSGAYYMPAIPQCFTF